ncbi:histidine phosphatase family protein [bacterium]|nr:histidine phosphatase family protein [bacterium]
MSVYIVRHGETDWNREGIYQGQTDTPLNENGRKSARDLGFILNKIKFTSIYSSDLLRARETAEIINSFLNVPIYYTENLRELDFGRWTGISIWEMSEKDPELFKRWQEDPWNVSPPGGETFRELTERVMGVLESIFERHKNENVLVVSHAGPIKAMIFGLLSATGKAYWNLNISHRAVVIIEKDTDYRISMTEVLDNL